MIEKITKAIEALAIFLVSVFALVLFDRVTAMVCTVEDASDWVLVVVAVLALSILIHTVLELILTMMRER